MATTLTITESNQLHPSQSGEAHEQPLNDHPPASKKHAAWFVLGAAFGVVFVGVGYTNAFGVFQQHYQSKLFPDRDPSELILIGSVASSLYMILGAVAGRFADICGYQTSLTLGSILMIVGLFTASVSTEYYQFFLSQGLTFGLGIAFTYYPAVTISRQYFGSHRHGLTNGIVVSGGALGGCILPYVVRVLLVQRGLAETFRILGYLAVGILIPSIVLLRPKTKQTTNRSKGILDLSLLKDQRFIIMLIAGTIAMTGFLPRYFLITPSAIQQGIPEIYAAWLLGIMNGLSIVGRVGIGMLADRYGKLKALILSFVLCGLGHIAFWLPSVLVSSNEAVTALFTLFAVYTGLFGSGFVSLIPVVVSHLFGSADLASKIGLLNSIMGLGVLAGPSAVYAIISKSQDWSAGVLTSGLLMVVGGLIMIATYKYDRPRD